jgi:hypothetical protein
MLRICTLGDRLQLRRRAESATPKALARDLEHRLSDLTLSTERDLVSNMDRVDRVTSNL